MLRTVKWHEKDVPRKKDLSNGQTEFSQCFFRHLYTDGPDWEFSAVRDLGKCKIYKINVL